MRAAQLSVRAELARLSASAVRGAACLAARSASAARRLASARRRRLVERRQRQLEWLLSDFNEREWLARPARRAEDELRRLRCNRPAG